jgi:hypothetical protein
MGEKLSDKKGHEFEIRVSLLICTGVLGKQMFLDINHLAFYLKEKCYNSLICVVFFAVVRG